MVPFETLVATTMDGAVRGEHLRVARRRATILGYAGDLDVLGVRIVSPLPLLDESEFSSLEQRLRDCLAELSPAVSEDVLAVPCQEPPLVPTRRTAERSTEGPRPFRGGPHRRGARRAPSMR